MLVLGILACFLGDKFSSHSVHLRPISIDLNYCGLWPLHGLAWRSAGFPALHPVVLSGKGLLCSLLWFLCLPSQMKGLLNWERKAFVSNLTLVARAAHTSGSLQRGLSLLSP